MEQPSMEQRDTSNKCTDMGYLRPVQQHLDKEENEKKEQILEEVPDWAAAVAPPKKPIPMPQNGSWVKGFEDEGVRGRRGSRMKGFEDEGADEYFRKLNILVMTRAVNSTIPTSSRDW
ncbi:hypothetical protein ISF_07486 [Cordyceps fumosorosea ARSEF 2679]|uniref:Uncharacterized protein n=1 Tax=Cordyceps fumosorosea (strain ARSEF 2679) TaxID=1081104 RepID=A0A167P980_CORFA|nr:hypothetical protein ISF_07486 [Cordyceps fumosorosea ARSEF 2679]OAA56418.1 hypothetical protein ISF_07486 [Cordyceps fumosorosea ARSEF 2679]